MVKSLPIIFVGLFTENLYFAAVCFPRTREISNFRISSEGEIDSGRTQAKHKLPEELEKELLGGNAGDGSIEAYLMR